MGICFKYSKYLSDRNLNRLMFVWSGGTVGWWGLILPGLRQAFPGSQTGQSYPGTGRGWAGSSPGDDWNTYLWPGGWEDAGVDLETLISKK